MRNDTDYLLSVAIGPSKPSKQSDYILNAAGRYYLYSLVKNGKFNIKRSLAVWTVSQTITLISTLLHF